MTAAPRKASGRAAPRDAAARRCVIGVDFDNTLADYDEVLRREAARRGLIAADAPRSKRAIRDRIRLLPGGELQWRKLQAAVYGPLMPQARLLEAVPAFLRECRRRRIPVRIVSHKNDAYELDETRTRFRSVAMDWMARKGFFAEGGLGLSRGDVYFEATRPEKLRRIRELGCTHFIDDLEETFAEPGFPAGVEKLLYDPHGDASAPPGVATFRSWEDIARHFFDAAD